MGIKVKHLPRAIKVQPRRGPVPVYPGYNTFQPRSLRARPIPGRLVHPVSMFTPLNRTFQPPMMGRPKLMRPPIHFVTYREHYIIAEVSNQLVFTRKA